MGSVLAGRRIAVTGAGGFIGSEVVRALLARGAEVRALIGPPGSKGWLPQDPAAHISFADIDDASAVERFVDGAEVVVHLAGPASVAASFVDPGMYERVHVAGTATVFDACRRARVRRLIQVSSAEVYGASARSPAQEDDPCRPVSPYGMSKLAAERIVLAGALEYGLEAVVLRLFSIYGPGSAPHSVLRSIGRQALGGDDIQIADSRPVRDYLFVRDAADAVLSACAAPLANGARVYNVGTGSGISVGDLALRVLAVLGREAAMRIGGTPDRPPGAGSERIVADVSRIHTELGWRATTALDDGLRITLESWDRLRTDP